MSNENDTRPTNPYADVYRGFVRETENHRLVVEHDIGMHRTLFVGAPGTGMWSWRIITSPGYLFTVGDVADGFTFSRVLDMLNFFERPEHSQGYYSDGSPSIDFRYWAEKLQGDQRDLAKEYSSESFLRHVSDSLDEFEEYNDIDDDFDREEILSQARIHSEDEHTAREWLGTDENQRVFGQDAYWEWDLKDYTPSFLIACYAIELTVRLYRQHAATRQGAPGDDYVLVEGGLVQNDPALPVFDLDVLDSDLSVDEVFDELFDLFERIHQHGDQRRPAPQGLLAYAEEIKSKLLLATGDAGHHAPQMIADVEEKYARRIERAKRIE